ncbi:MAG TPA: HAMP domain-containing sensor histidine kinase [Dermatophilaceae bacterium]|nr:HAMP domain-containing sensor histidine kinase [Dermatophilaceae bacterium]
MGRFRRGERMAGARRRRILSVRSRIVVAIVAVAALGLVASGAASYVVQRKAILAAVDAKLLHTVPNLKTIAAGKTSTAPLTSVDAVLRVAMQQIIPGANQSALGFVDQKPALVPAVNLSFRIEKDRALVARIVSEAHPSLVVIGTAKSHLGTLRYLVVPVRVAGDPSTGLYVAAYDLDAELDSLAESFQTYFRVALAALVLLGLVAWFVAGRLLRPIRLLRDAAAGSSTAAELTERIPVTGRDDVSELATAINAMFDRLQDSSKSQVRLLNDVGHELKTPITIIRTHLELLDAGNASEVEATRTLAIEELDRMSTLVSEISLLAASKAPHFVEPAEVDLDTLTAAVAAKASALDPARTWRVESATGLAVIDARHITEAWLQLADNAVKYSTPGGPIVIGTEVSENGTGPWLNLSVRDSGPGIPLDDRERVFERFSRLDSSRTTEGSGLGLSIVSAIAEAHGGTVLLSGEPGEGTTFTIQVPLLTGAQSSEENKE